MTTMRSTTHANVRRYRERMRAKDLRQIGRTDGETMLRVGRALAVWIGIA